MKKLHLAVFVFIFLLAGVLRLYRFDNPVADWHSWRQSDTSAVSRNFVKDGFDVLHPIFDDLSNVPSGKDNPHGYRFVEFPLYNSVQAGLFVLFGTLTLEQWGRIVSIVASLFSMLFLYLLVKKHAGETAGVISAFFFGILPFNIYYSRTILPDPSMVMATLGAIYFFSLWAEENFKFQISNFKFIFALLFSICALLLKPYAIFFFLPMIVLAYSKFGLGIFRKWQLWLYAILTIAPLVLWRIWMMQYPEGIPANSWLFNAGNIRFKGAFFNWLFAERIGKLISGYWGIVLLVLGVLFSTGKSSFTTITRESSLLLLSFLGSSLLYLTIIARGNVQHDYYQILIIPSVAIMMGLGGSYLLTVAKEQFGTVVPRVLFVVCTLFTLFFSWYFVRDYYNINNSVIVEAGKAADLSTPADAKILAPYNGDTTLLYQTNRQGWASYQRSLEGMIDLGADYLLIVNPSESDRDIAKRFLIVTQSDQYVLLHLKQPL